MKVIASHLHKKAITLFPYLDNWLSRNQNCLALLEHRQFIIHLIVKLGLISNQEKSDLIPSQKYIFIRMEFLTQHSQNSSRQNSGSVRDYQSFSSQNNSHSQIIPVSFGKTLPLGLVAMAKESFHRLLMGKWLNCIFSITSKVI